MASSFYVIQIKEVFLQNEATEKEAAYKKQMKLEYGLDDNGEDELTGDELKTIKTGKKWNDWLKLETFYIYGMVYMMVRVAINLTMTL